MPSTTKRTTPTASIFLSTDYAIPELRQTAFVDIRIYTESGERFIFRNTESDELSVEGSGRSETIYVPNKYFWRLFATLSPEHLDIDLTRVGTRWYAGENCFTYKDWDLSQMLIGIAVAVWYAARHNDDPGNEARRELVSMGLLDDPIVEWYHAEKRVTTHIVMACPDGWVAQDTNSSWQFYIPRDQIPDTTWAEYNGNGTVTFTTRDFKYYDFAVVE